ncbi:MAG: diguanylate cyclase [Eubacterium sp.]|nr:diguanylate cyclase [Eubacterium sp.]
MDRASIYIPYVITEAFCILFSVGIIIKANKNVGTDTQMRHFRGMALYYILYLLCDGIWALGEGGLIPFNVTGNIITSTMGLVAVSLLILGWCVFVIYRIGQENTKKMKMLIRIHYIVAAVDIMLIVSSAFTNFIFYIDENGFYKTTDWYTLHLALVFLQLFGSGVHSYVQSFSDKEVKIKKEYRLPLFFIIFPAIAGVLEGMIPLTPIVPLGTFLAILFSFLEIQNSEIYTDALTGLNNRRRMEIFLQDVIHTATEEKPVSLYMIDVNDFKQVNDKFGHLVGDRALQLVADAIRNVSEKNRGFCARYGGDEFVLILREKADIRNALQEKVDSLRARCADLIPQISICYGCAICTSGGMTAAGLIAQADEKLYIQKEIYHRNRG